MDASAIMQNDTSAENLRAMTDSPGLWSLLDGSFRSGA